MRIGTLAYRTRTGLGYQVLDYVKHLEIQKVLVVDLSIYNGVELTSWYPRSKTTVGYPKDADLEDFLNDLDVVILAETPLNYNLYTIAKRKGVKTVCVPNWEFFDHIIHPEYPLPDMFIAPSVWHLDELQDFATANNVKLEQIHHPVDTNVFKARVRTTKKFMHVAGKPASNDRNGTWDFMQAVPDGVVITQSRELAIQIRRKYRHSNVFTNVSQAHQIYDHGDILVLPRKYGGNCLPLNEALASGCPVIMPDVSPNNHLLPQEWLVKAHKVSQFTPRTAIDIYEVDQADLAQRLDYFKNCDIQAESQKAIAIADTISWSRLKTKYMKALASL